MSKFRACIRSAILTMFLGVAPAISIAADDHAGHDHAGHEKHSEHGHDQHHKAAEGGIIADLGDYHGELIQKSGSLALLVTDHHGKPVAVDGFKASVLVLDGSQRFGPYDIVSTGGNMLSGAGPDEDLKAWKGIVTLTDANGKAVQGRFEPK